MAKVKIVSEIGPLWIVERWGVYHQGVVGIFTTERRALIAQGIAQKREPGDYHSLPAFTVRRIIPNEISRLTVKSY